jgi:protein-L-isoaspartate(D-aspartate) O-methyltransferase
MDLEIARRRLIEKLATEIKDKRVLSAMKKVRRELFIAPELIDMAYDDSPLPIGYNQTISQPYIVALMTETLELKGNEKVLEIGTGSGYQTAILAELAHQVITTERLLPLMEKARVLLDKLGYRNIELHLTEKILGWENGAPYDAIIATAAAPEIPECLLSQLAIEGRMVIPVGPRYEQDLCKVIKHKDSNEIVNLGGCRFVSMVGQGAWEEHGINNNY